MKTSAEVVVTTEVGSIYKCLTTVTDKVGNGSYLGVPCRVEDIGRVEWEEEKQVRIHIQC